MSKFSSGSEQYNDIQMTAVPKDLFFEGMQLPTDIFFKLNPDTYLVIGKMGDKASFSDYHSFSNPNFRIYVKSTDHNILIDYVTELTSKLITKPDVPHSVKVKFLGSLVDDSLAALEREGLTSAQQLTRASRLVVDLTQSLPSFTDVMTLLSQIPDEDAKHAMASCMTSLVLAEELSMDHRSALEKLTLGSLLHDIGMRFLPPQMREKPRHLWSPDELVLYEMHPLKSVEMLRDLKEISNDVLLIVAEHHETSQGTGFPKRLRDVKISPLGKICALANCFAELVFTNNDQGKKYTPDEAIEFIDNVLGQPYNRQMFSALKNLVNKQHLADLKLKAS